MCHNPILVSRAVGGSEAVAETGVPRGGRDWCPARWQRLVSRAVGGSEAVAETGVPRGGRLRGRGRDWCPARWAAPRPWQRLVSRAVGGSEAVAETGVPRGGRDWCPARWAAPRPWQRLVSRAVGGSEAVAEVAVAGAARFPVILSVALSALALSSCGEIALGLGLIVTCVKVFQSYEEVLSGGGRPAALKAYTSVTLALVWLWVTLFHLPCLLVWSRTRSESSQLLEDPSLAAALVLCNSGAVLWRDAAPRLDLAGYRAVAAVVHTAAVAVYLFGLLNVYRAGWLAAAAVLAMAVHQLTAPVREIPAEPATGAEQEAPEAEQEAPEGEQTQEQEAEQQEQDGAAGGDGDSGPEDAADDQQPCPADSADSAPAGGPGGDGVRRR
ncbi:hypothetical protein FJT64_023100 [Amphibalanus amphitrite]|uniref:Uncharacterized protein n=1 Tax=Amphibalanus amphitrite TaxID=1232801 RepID=A0A6A4WEU4_AMPAM|nr:hypothetical protein FJT64_023100 [Amphibalanus amphitrite]